MCNYFSRGGNCKIIDLAEKEDGYAIESTLVEARFVESTGETKRFPSQDVVDHVGP